MKTFCFHNLLPAQTESVAFSDSWSAKNPRKLFLSHIISIFRQYSLKLVALNTKEPERYRIKHSSFSYPCPVSMAGQHREQPSNLRCYWIGLYTLPLLTMHLVSQVLYLDILTIYTHILCWIMHSKTIDPHLLPPWYNRIRFFPKNNQT